MTKDKIIKEKETNFFFLKKNQLKTKRGPKPIFNFQNKWATCLLDIEKFKNITRAKLSVYTYFSRQQLDYYFLKPVVLIYIQTTGFHCIVFYYLVMHVKTAIPKNCSLKLDLDQCLCGTVVLNYLQTMTSIGP